jgi:hypothetical protein
MNGNQVLSTVNGLGDYDDILMMTTRNEHEPFVGRVPANVRAAGQNGTAYRFNVTTNEQGWDDQTIQSPLAEVAWFAIENPTEAENANDFFGEPGMRTIYRRTLLIAPWVNPYRWVSTGTTTTTSSDTFRIGSDTFKAEPGLVRILDVDREEVADAIAAIIAFQDRYDLSVRLEWDHNIQRWKIMANTLADLTKRENRFGHFGFFQGPGTSGSARRIFPYPFVSWGSGYQGDQVDVVLDPEVLTSGSTSAQVRAHLGPNDSVVSYRVVRPGTGYRTRPFVYVADECSALATANAILNDAGEIVRVIHGPVPLWGERRGEDVMLTGALAFDLRVFDPGAPLFGMREPLGSATSPIGVVLEPSDAGYTAAYLHIDNSGANGIGFGGNSFPLLGQGAYVDMGYGFSMQLRPPGMMNAPRFASASAALPWFFTPRALSDVLGNQLAPGYAVYDTWSFHYENNGVNDDGDEVEIRNGVPTWQIDNNNGQGTPSIDEGTNGLDDYGHYSDGNHIRLGVDDVGERETAPPYDKPLRGVQVLMRVYESDSRAIRQVRVNQHFMPE